MYPHLDRKKLGKRGKVSSEWKQLMKLAPGNLFCHKTVHKREMSFKGAISMGNNVLYLLASLRQRDFAFHTSFILNRLTETWNFVSETRETGYGEGADL